MKRDKRTLTLLAAGAAVFLGLSACTSGAAGPSGGQTAASAPGGGAQGGGAQASGGQGGGAPGNGAPASSHQPPTSLAPNPSAVPAISPTTPGRPSGVALKLTATGLVSGGTITSPLTVGYTVAGAAARAIHAASGYKLRLIPGDGPTKAPLEYDMPITAASGDVTLSPGPSFTSTDDFTFELLAPGGNVIAFVTIRHLTINGPV